MLHIRILYGRSSGIIEKIIKENWVLVRTVLCYPVHNSTHKLANGRKPQISANELNVELRFRNKIKAFFKNTLSKICVNLWKNISVENLACSTINNIFKLTGYIK